eukprot:s1727_g13.t1
MRRARLVARDFLWLDPGRTDVFALAGGQSLLRLVPAIGQLRGWDVISIDVKDAYLMCEQPRLVKVVLDAKLAEELNDKSLVILIHVDDMALTGTPESLKYIKEFLQKKYKVAIEDGGKINFLKRDIEMDGSSTRIRVNSKYLEGLVKMMGGVKSRRTPGDMDLDETPVEDFDEIKLYRSGVGTLLYIAGDRPDVQFLVKELASKLQKPTRGAMNTLKRLIGYLHTTTDYHIKMAGRDPSASFRDRAQGLTSTPPYVDSKDVWLVEDLALSSTESEFVVLVSGAAEGLLVAAVLRHVVNEPVELKVYADNNAAVCIASREGGVGRLRHLDGRLLWVQQRNNRDFQQTCEIAVEPLGFSNDMEDLGCYELEEESVKRNNKEKIHAIRKVVYSEVQETGHAHSSTLVNQLAKKLVRLTLGALPMGGGEALGQSSATCLVSSEASTTTLTVSMLVTINFVLVTVLVIMLVLKIAYNMHRRIQETQKTMEWVRRQLDRRQDRRAIRAAEEARAGIYLESADEESVEEEVDHDEGEVNGAWIRMVRLDEEEEPEMEEVEVEPEPTGGNGGFDYEMEDEESEESGFETDYGSLGVIEEKDSDYEGLDEDAYDDCRFELLGRASGVEHYILKKLAALRKMTMCEETWFEIRDLMNMHNAVQMGGASSRRDVIDYLRNRRRYDCHFRAGRLTPGEGLEESDMPDAWIAAQFRTQYGQVRGDDDDEEASWLGDEGGAAAMAEEAEEETPVVHRGDPISVVVDAVADELLEALEEMDDGGLGSSTDPLAPALKAKSGGKGRDGHPPKDPDTEPTREDEADDHV